MYKLMIIIPSQIEIPVMQDGWPEFLHAAEDMPGLIREASVRVATSLYGTQEISMIHELFFETLEDLQAAMRSQAGLDAGGIIQQLTNGQMTLLVAEHREDSIKNLRQHLQND